MITDQDAVDWHIVHEAVSDAIDNAEGKPGGNDLQRAFKKHGLLVVHAEDVGTVPDRECFWLVERNVSPPQYVSTNTAGWHSDPWQARRFKTEREAHDYWRLMGEIDRPQFKVIEHMFLNKALSTPEQLAETSKFMADNGL